MQIKTKATEINRSYEDLAPFFAKKVKEALAECHDQDLEIEMFESYRSPERQDYLYAQGRTRDGKKVTNACAWQSFHQFSVACDLCFKWGGKWQWNKDDPWDKVHAVFIKHGFEVLKMEKAHVQITGGLSVQKASKIAHDRGLLALWSIIEANCT